MNEQQIQVREGAAVWREVDGETVLLALDSSLYLGLNRTGTALWPLLVEGTTRGELIDRLAAHYDIGVQRAAEDVDAFLASCRDQRLLVR